MGSVNRNFVRYMAGQILAMLRRPKEYRKGWVAVAVLGLAVLFYFVRAYLPEGQEVAEFINLGLAALGAWGVVQVPNDKPDDTEGSEVE